MTRALLLFALFAASTAAAADLSGDVTLVGWDHDLKPSAFGPTAHLGLTGRFGEAGAVWLEARLDALVDGRFRPADNSTRFTLGWHPAAWAEDEQLSLTLMPFSSRRLHLGFSYPVTFLREQYVTTPAVPAVVVELARKRWQTWLGARNETEEDRFTLEMERVWTVLGGAGVALPAGFRLDAQAEWGPSKQVPSAIAREARHLRRGIAVRIGHAVGVPVDAISEVTYDGGDPAFYETLARRPQYGGAFASFVSLEASQQWSDLVAPDDLQQMTTQPATAVALDARFQIHRTRLQGVFAVRTATFLQASVPSSPPFVAFPRSSVMEPNWLARLAADHAFEAAHLAPGVAVSFQLPATFTTPDPLGGERTTAVWGPNLMRVLRQGKSRSLATAAQAFVRWDPMDAITVLAQAGVEHNPAPGGVIDEPYGGRTTLWSAALTLQGRF